MKNMYALFFISIFCSFLTQAQDRYYDAIFPVQRTADVVYGTNIGIITGAPAPEGLKVDIYQPVGDTKTDRPLILLSHTGSFLPPLYNGQITGSRSDSTVVAIAAYLASRGFVVGAYTYRMGWLPLSPDQNQRTGSLLQAAFRGIQDTRTCIRFFKKTAAEDGNPYGIDPNKICAWGVGTGGYLSLGAASLHDWGEVTLDKFINTQTLQPYVDSTLLGNLDATTQKPLCLPNHADYGSGFQLSINMGGALGDSSWLDGTPEEPAYTGVHCPNDFFAPFYEGAVIVPTTNQFVVYATGTRRVMEVTNNFGSNDVLNGVDPGRDVLAPLINAQKANAVTLPLTGQNILLGTDNFYAFDIPLIYNGKVTPQGSPWDWWDYNTLKVVVDLINQQRGTNFNADTLHLNGLATNPDMSAQKGRAYLDTIYMLTIPRLCAALDLGCAPVAVKETDARTIGLSVSPVPAIDEFRIETSEEHPIRSVYLYDLEGRLVKAHTDIHASSFVVPCHQLKAGVYMLQTQTAKYRVGKQIAIQR